MFFLLLQFMRLPTVGRAGVKYEADPEGPTGPQTHRFSGSAELQDLIVC